MVRDCLCLSLAFLQKETAAVPDNDLAWSSLAQAYFNASKLEEAKAAAEKALDISPDDMQASNLLGMYWLQKGDVVLIRTGQAQFYEDAGKFLHALFVAFANLGVHANAITHAEGGEVLLNLGGGDFLDDRIHDGEFILVNRVGSDGFSQDDGPGAISRFRHDFQRGGPPERTCRETRRDACIEESRATCW